MVAHSHTYARLLLLPQPEQRYFAIVREPADMLYAAHQPMHALGLSVPLTSHFRPPISPVTLASVTFTSASEHESERTAAQTWLGTSSCWTRA